MKSIFLTLLLTAPSLLMAQSDPDLHHLMTKKIFHCEDVEYNSLSLMEKYYEGQQFDSLQMVMSYWKNRCGGTEQIIRMEILSKLRNRTFRQETYGQLLSEFLKKYKRRQQNLDSVIAIPMMGELYTANKIFDQFTKKIAAQIEPQYTIGSLESAICNYYMNNYRDFEILVKMDVVPEVVRKPPVQAAAEEDELAASAKFPIALRFLLYSGIWLPTNKLSKFSIHPMIGSSFGFTVARQAHFDFSIGYAFMQSKPYDVYDATGTFTSRHFENVTWAIEPSFIVYTAPDDMQFLIVAGVGTDWLTIVGEKELPTNKSIRFTSRSMSLGAGIQVPLNKKLGTFMGCQVRHYFLNFENKNGFDLNGDALTFRITYGASATIR